MRYPLRRYSNQQADNFEPVPSTFTRLARSIDLWQGKGTITPPTIGDSDGNRYVLDHEDIWRAVKAEESRFLGARRVENLVPTDSEDLEGGDWSEVNTASILDTNTVSFPAVNDFINLTLSSNAVVAGEVVTTRVSMSGTGTVSLRISRVGAGSAEATKASVTLSSSTQVFSISHTFLAVQSGFRLDILRDTGDTATSVTVNNYQIQNKSGASDESTPDDYVSVGVLSSPFHGANVDGVKYFNTVNGNSVASNVVTEATGAAISESTIKGLMVEGQATELTGYSADLTNAGGGATVTANIVGIDGTPNTGFTIDDDSAASILNGGQTVVAVADDSSTHYGMFAIKYDASPSVYPALRISLSGGTGLIQKIVLDPSDGTYATNTGEGAVISVTRIGDWWWVLLSLTNNSSGNTSFTIYVEPAFNTDGSGSGDVSAQGTTGVGFIGVYTTTFSFSPIFTTGGTTGTRQDDTEYLLDVNNWPEPNITITFELSMLYENISLSGGGGILNAHNSVLDGFGILAGSTDAPYLNDSAKTEALANRWSAVLQTMKVGGRGEQAGGNIELVVDGNSSTEGVGDADFSPSGNIYIGKNTTLGFCIKNLKIYNRDLGSAYLESVTS